MLMGFIIWSIASLIFFYIGVSALKSDKAVGFFTFGEVPVIENVKDYNKSVAKLWIIYSVIFEIIGIPLCCLEQNSPLILLLMPAVVIWVISLIIIYLKIESKFRK